MSVGGFASTYSGYQDKDNTKYEPEQEKERGSGEETPLSSPRADQAGGSRSGGSMTLLTNPLCKFF